MLRLSRHIAHRAPRISAAGLCYKVEGIKGMQHGRALSAAATHLHNGSESEQQRKTIKLRGKTTRKEYLLTRMDNVFSQAQMVAVMQHNSLNVAQFNELREVLGKQNMRLTMFPNTLARVALKGTAFEQLNPLFHNSSLVVYSPDANVKALSDAVKKHSKLSLLGVYVDGLTLDMNMVKTYLNLPPITQLYGELLGVINHPPRMLAAVLQRGSSDLVMNLQRYIDDKKSGDEASSGTS